jgi:hypothetical protein
MANPHRGEISAVLDGREYTLCLTLGALAELEQALGADDLVALAERFEKGRIASSDAIRIIGAGLRGAGNGIGDADVAAMRCDDAAAGFIAIVARLLSATFGAGGEADEGAEAANPPPAGR